MKISFLPLIAICLVLGCTYSILNAQKTAAPELTVNEQCDSLCSRPEAAWQSIPWQIDLIKAQHLSVEQSKPIFIWSMDGHPLTCT